MKKILAIILCFIMLAGIMTGCGGSAAGNGTRTSAPTQDQVGKISIVTTIFPLYDWTRQIIGAQTSVDLVMLLDNGVDLHSYQPTADDIVKISTCDLFIYVGGESDKWVQDAQKETVNPDQVAVSLMETLGDTVREEEQKPGMQAEAEAEEAEEEPEYDEHIWLSLKNAETCCRAIAENLGTIDPQNKAAYAANADAYIQKLRALDAQYRSAADGARIKTLVFADRFPFRYLTDDYGLDYYAAFAGCSAETEASFQTILFLAHRIDALGLSAILQIETSDGSIARTVQQSTKTKDQTILTLDSLQSVTSDDVQAGATYLAKMEQNLEVLKEALR